MVFIERMKSTFNDSENSYQEVQLLKKCQKLKLPNILPLVEVYQKSDTIYLVTKYLPAGSLLNFLNKMPSQFLDE